MFNSGFSLRRQTSRSRSGEFIRRYQRTFVWIALVARENSVKISNFTPNVKTA
jgi:hypothetical protein